MVLNQPIIEKELRERFLQANYRNNLQDVECGIPKFSRDILTFFKERVVADFPFTIFEVSFLTKDWIGGQSPIMSVSIGIKEGLKLADILLFVEHQNNKTLEVKDVMVTTYDAIYQAKEQLQTEQKTLTGITIGYVENWEKLHFLDSIYVNLYTKEKTILLGTAMEKGGDAKRKVLAWGEHLVATPYLEFIPADEDVLEKAKTEEVIILGDREMRDRFLESANRVFFLDATPDSIEAFDADEWVCVTDQTIYDNNALKFYERKKRR